MKASPSVDDFQPELSSDALDFFGMDEKKSSSQRKVLSYLYRFSFCRLFISLFISSFNGRKT